MWNALYRKPRILVLTLALLLVSGLSALQVLPRREDPELVTRNAKIVTVYPGASAERIESQVTDKIEEELAELDEIIIIESSSDAGVSVINIELDESIVRVDEVWSKVRDKLDDAEVELPAGASAPDFEESTITAFTLVVALTWDDVEGLGGPNRAILGRLAEDLEDRLEALPGTDDVELYGEPEEEIRVLVDAERLVALGLTPDSLARALEQADAKVPAGNVRGTTRDLLIEVEGEFEALRRVSEVPVQQGADGTLVRLGEVARLEKTHADPPDEIALIGGRDGVIVAARMRPNKRVDAWVASARDALADFEAGLPAGLGLEVLFDQAQYTQKRLDSLFANLGLAGVLVMLVVFFSMGWRSALLVGTALPLTVLAVLAWMNLLGLPMHQMSVTGLIIALGLLIDNAIVMTDEVSHALRGGGSTASAIEKAVKRLAVPLLGSTVTTILAFMPLVIVPGAVGEFVGAMSLAVILAIGSSLAISLTIIPALSGWMERWVPAGGTSFWQRGVGSARLTAAYRWTLERLVRRPWLGLAAASVLPIVGFAGGSTLQEQFFPPSGRDQVQVELRLPEGTAIAHTRRVAEEARAAMLEHPAVSDVHWVVGASAPKFYYNMLETQEGAPQYAQALVQLSTEEDLVGTVHDLQRVVDAEVPEAQLLVRQLEQGPPFQAPIVVRLYGPDLEVLQGLSNRVRAELAAVPTVTHTRSTLSTGRPKLAFEPDEEELVSAGLDRVGLARRLQSALEGSLGGSLFEAGEELPVRVRLDDTERSSVERVTALEMFNENGWTNLSALGSLELVPEPGSVPRRNGRRLTEVHGFVTAGTLVADSLDAFQERLAATGFQLPPGYELEYGGEGEERNEAVANLASTVGVLLVLMVATLVLSLSSFRMASIIGSVAFLSVGLSLGSLWLFGYPFGFMAIVGTMGLIGIAINDAIVVLSALREDAAARTGDVRAIVDVVVHSSRHVLSTTITTVAGFLPLIFSTDGLWPPLAVAIAGGVVGATLLALVLVPSAFRILRPRTREVKAPALSPALA